MKVLNLDNWCEEAIEVLEEHELGLHYGEGEMIEGYIANLNNAWPEPKHFPNLKFVASCTTGLDHIDVDYCKKKGIKIISLQGETEFLQDVHATAEHTIALMLSLIRKIPFAHNYVCNGNWDRERWQGTELHGKTLGIIGYGRVGKQVAKIAKAFGMRIIYNDPYSELTHFPLDYVLENADIISIHVPLNDSTRYMFEGKEFSLMKPTAYFINTSRGAVVSPNALHEALLYNKISGAAIDVLEGEPDCLNFNILGEALKHKVVITPHIAGNTAESRKKTQIFIAHKIKEYIESAERSIQDDI